MESLPEKLLELLTIYGLKVLTAIVVFIIGRWIAKGLANFTEKAMNKKRLILRLSLLL
jgi:small conductance mechanosensitive channel